MLNDVFEKALGKDLTKFLEFNETETHIAIKPKQFLHKDLWREIHEKLRENFHATYDNQTWAILKTNISKAVSTDEKQPTAPIMKEDAYEGVEPIHQQMENKQLQKQRQTEVSETKEYDLNLSKQKLGALVPILTDVNGNIIDGFHRKEIDPKWPTICLPYIKDSVQLSMARLASNVCRRNVSAEEKTKLLTNIAELTTWDAKQIAQALGMSYRWVTTYLPEKFKDKEKAFVGTKGGQATAQAYRESQDFGASRAADPFESKSLTPTIPTKEIDTGFIFECPTCERKFHLIHIDPSGRHKFEEDKGSP